MQHHIALRARRYVGEINNELTATHDDKSSYQFGVVCCRWHLPHRLSCRWLLWCGKRRGFYEMPEEAQQPYFMP